MVGAGMRRTRDPTERRQNDRGRVRALAVAMDKRHAQLPDVPTFKELGLDWVDGAYRGIGVPKSTPPEVPGFELVNIPVDRMPAFFAARQKEYVEIAKRMGLVR